MNARSIVRELVQSVVQSVVHQEVKLYSDPKYDAYFAGRKAKRRGKLPANNPHKRDSELHHYWHTGWTDENNKRKPYIPK
jgi:hypothetical protein